MKSSVDELGARVMWGVVVSSRISPVSVMERVSRVRLVRGERDELVAPEKGQKGAGAGGLAC